VNPQRGIVANRPFAERPQGRLEALDSLEHLDPHSRQVFVASEEFSSFGYLRSHCGHIRSNDR